jgi:spermidine/putrescine transport system substrate-binding protein
MKRLALLLASLLLALPALAARDELHLYNWNNYLAPETVKRFEEFCKCTVVQTYYSDNEELLAKLAAGAKGYDMYVPTSHAVQTLIRSGRLIPSISIRRSIPATSFRSLTHMERRSSATTTRR